MILVLIMFYLSTAIAQNLDILEEQIVSQNEQIKIYRLNVLRDLAKIENAKLELKEKKNHLEELTNINTNFLHNKELVKSRIEDSLKALPLYQKVGGRKGRFLQCLKETLEKNGIIKISICRYQNSADFSHDDEIEFSDWEKKLGGDLKRL